MTEKKRRPGRPSLSDGLTASKRSALLTWYKAELRRHGLSYGDVGASMGGMTRQAVGKRLSASSTYVDVAWLAESLSLTPEELLSKIAI